MTHIDSPGDSHELPGSVGNGNSTNTSLATIESQLQPVPAVGWHYGPPQRPEILSAKANPIELMHAVRRRWPMAIGLGLTVGIIAAGLVWYFVPIKYEAYALLRIGERQSGILTDNNEGPDAFSIFKRTQVQMFRSGPVLRGTVREPEIQRLKVIQEHDDDPVAWLKEELLLDYPDDAEILRVAISTENKNEAMKIVDAVVDKYLSEVVQADRNRNLAQEDKLERKYLDLVAEFTREKEALLGMEQVARVDTTSAGQVERRLAEEGLYEAILHRNNILRDIYQTEVDIAVLKARQEEPDTARIPDAVVEIELTKDPFIMHMVLEKSEMHAALAQQMTVTKNPQSSSHVQKLQALIYQIEEQIDEYKAQQRPHVIEKLNAEDMMNRNPVSRTVMTVNMLEKQKAHLEEQLVEARDHVADEQRKFEQLAQDTGNVTAKREAVEALNQIMAEVKAKLDRTAVERLAQERIQKVDDAQLDSPRGTRISKYVAVAFSGILGFSAVVFGIAFYEFQSRKLNGTQQINDGLGIKVIGELPSVTGRTWRRVKGGKGPAVLKALMSERIDGTRTALIHSTAIESPRVVMVTSADPHEGKTTTSSQLAASLARAGRRTLLVDADIRNPGVHRVFDMPLEPGLSELLRGEEERDAVVHPTRTANLWLLPAGHCDLRSVQALATSYLGTAIAGLCVQFDYVVIDSGPILKVADSLQIGQHVDAAILSVLKDQSKMPHVYEACERLRSVGITVMGAVVNGVNDDAARHGVELLMSETT